jgi:hypothetical protein
MPIMHYNMYIPEHPDPPVPFKSDDSIPGNLTPTLEIKMWCRRQKVNLWTGIPAYSDIVTHQGVL